MTAPVLGIDLGTTNSVVAIADGQRAQVLSDAEGYQLIPSVVSFHPSGDILVGRVARERRLLDARNTVYSVKRLIGRPFRSPEVRTAQERFPFTLAEGPTGGVLVEARDETYTLSEISAFVLRQVRAVAELNLGEPCTRAVVTVPANFNELQRSATKAAGRVAGLDVVRILNEPTAAALAYGYGRGSRERIAVFDLGGGTFDITILELSGDVFEVLATAGDTFLGGDDIDVLIAEQMADAFLEHHRYDARHDAQAYERLRAAAEWAKCQLSAEMDVQLRVEELAYGDGGISLDLTFALTRQSLERMAHPLVARAFDVCEDAMRVAGVRPTQLDNVVLVGGSTRIPLVQRMVTEYFGREPLRRIDPDLVVAQGAGIQGRALTAPADRAAVGKLSLKRITAAELEKAKSRAERGPDRPASVGPPPMMGYLEDEDTAIVLESVPPSDRPQHVVGSHPAEPIRATHPMEAPRVPPPPPLPGAARGFAPGATTLEGPAFAVAPSEAVRAGLKRPTFGDAPVVHEPLPRGPAFAPDRVVADGSLGAIAVGGAPIEALHDASPSGEVAPPPMPEPEMPLLLDVTPHTLGVETVSGFCESVIRRNSAIPVEQTRMFSTARDDQEVVRVRIYQGESRRLDENEGLGEIELSGIRPAPRGQIQIGVTFEIAADGTLAVRAKDLETGKEQTVRINLVGGVPEEEIRAMQRRQAALARRQA